MFGLCAVLALIVLSGALLGCVTWRERQPRPLESVQLRFNRDLTTEIVEGILSSIAGLPRRSPVVFEVIGNGEGIRHRLHAEPDTLATLRSQLRGVIPSLRLDRLPSDEQPDHTWRAGLRLRWGGQHPVLQTERPAQTAAALLGAFSALAPKEELRLLWVVSAASRPALPSTDRQRDSRLPFESAWLGTRQPSPEHLRALRHKYGKPLIRGRAILIAKGNASALLGRVTSLLRSRQSSYGHLLIAPQRPASLSRLAFGFHHSSRFSAEELAGLLALPIEAPRVPGLTLTSAPQLMPATNLPRVGRVYAHSDWPGLEDRPLAQSVKGGLSHALVVGPTGSGKSHLLANLVAQDLNTGRGCLVFDGKGDLAREVLARIPTDRQDEVIVLNPSSGLPMPGLRVFARGTDPELTADLVLGIFRELFADSWGIRSDRWLRAGLVTLAQDEAATLADLSRLFSDTPYRQRLVGQLQDPLLIDTWAVFEAMSQRERSHQLGSPLTKLSEVIGRRLVRGILAQPDPQLDMRQVLASGKVVVISLSAGRLGTPAVRLISALVFHQLFQAVQARGGLAPAKRQPFFVYVDEPKVLADMPVPLDSLFEMARGLGVGLTLGAQSLAQLPKSVSQAALTNAATIVAFKQAADDAALLARELVGLTAEELQGLGTFEVAVRLGLGPGNIAPVATGITLPLPKPTSDPRAVARASAQRYGRDLAVIDRALSQRRRTSPRSSEPTPETPVGRLRRSS